MTPGIEKILAQLDSLTAAEREQLRHLLDREQGAKVCPGNKSLIGQVKGKYSFVPTSSAAFAARKRSEIELESRADRQ